MDDLNFTSNTVNQGAQSGTAFDAAAARKFFSSAGKEETIAAGSVIFAENKKSSRLLLQRDKMYLLVDGTVELTVQDKRVGIVQQGEIFGEMTSITQTPRSATATAASECHLISLDDKQFQSALHDNPEFALNLMALMAKRLRSMLGAVNAKHGLSTDTEWNDSYALDKKLLARLAEELGHNAIMRYEQGKIIMQEGQTGVLMYIVQEGDVEISIQGTVVESVDAGGIFGEMALIERSPRMASATAASDCVLLAINHKAFIDLVHEDPEFGIAILTAIGERARFILSQVANQAA